VTVNPLAHQPLVADVQARHRLAAADHRLARQSQRLELAQDVPGLRAGLGRVLIQIGYRLVQHAAARADRRTWAAG
jgi:hypothetical protein